jgi:hypothetical protein
MATLTKAKVKVANGTATGDQVVTCIEGFVTSALEGGPFPVAPYSRWYASHPVVQHCGQFFALDGTPQDELARLRAKLYAEAEQDVPLPEPPPQPERRIRDEDVLLEIGSGRRVRKDSLEVKNRPDWFVEINPNKIPRADAVVALADLTIIGEDLKPERTIHRGQWARRGDRFAQLHPHSFVLPAFAEE